MIVDRLANGLRRVVHDLEPERLDGVEAARLVERFAEIGRLSEAAVLLLTPRVDETNVWKRGGHRSPADYLAKTRGTSVGRARGMSETAERLGRLSKTRDAVRAGRLSPEQADAVTDAAALAPEAEDDLLAHARDEGLAGLRRFAERVKAEARSNEDEEERYERIRAQRSLRTWTDADGAGRGEWRLTPDAHAQVVAAIRGAADRVFRDARKQRRREGAAAYAADALVELVTRDAATDTKGSRPTVLLRVDAEKLQRDGCDDAAGICEIAGVGPVPVSVARKVLGNDAMVKLVITKGVDVLNVTHIGRTRIAAVQTALDWLYDECGIVDCHHRVAIQVHHTAAYRDTGHTTLPELVPLCTPHHRIVETQGFTLQKRPDAQYDLIPPDHLTDPRDERGPP